MASARSEDVTDELVSMNAKKWKLRLETNGGGLGVEVAQGGMTTS